MNRWLTVLVFMWLAIIVVGSAHQIVLIEEELKESWPITVDINTVILAPEPPQQDILVDDLYARAEVSDLRYNVNMDISRGEEVPIGISAEDYELLARIIYAEARGESYKGKVAVAAVVVNRVKSDRFREKTIKDVILAPGQFSPVVNGKINVTPTDDCYRAAKQALTGEDPTEGSVFFYNAKTATCKWIVTTHTNIVIENHTFSS